MLPSRAMAKNWSNVPFHPGRWPFFYGWIILVWASLGILMSVPGQTIGVSVFTDYLLQALSVTRDELSFAYMLGTIGSSFLLPWAGRMYDRLGVRMICTTAAIGLGIVLVTFSQVDIILKDWLGIQTSFVILIFLVFGFLFLRFFGQGVLTMASRNMMIQWFDRRRGLATGFSNVVVALSFSSAPVVLYHFIAAYDWRGAWLLMAFVVGVVFPVIVVIFFRSRPEDSGLIPDGPAKPGKQIKQAKFPVVKAFTLREVRMNYAFWVFGLMLAMQGLYITGFTFHVVSIFGESGLSEMDAITIFQPSAVLAVGLTLGASALSDHIHLKYLLYAKGIGAMLGIIGLIYLSEGQWAYYLIILGNGVMTGLFSVLSTVTWPRYYGRAHLGAISGQFISLVVFGSALGPILFSLSLTYSGSYQLAGWLCLGVYFILTIAGFKADNPQVELAEEIKSHE